MASQVMSGSNDPSYTNITGQNVRVVINFMASLTAMSWSRTNGGATSVSTPFGVEVTIGRNLAFNTGGTSYLGFAAANNLTFTSTTGGDEFYEVAFPTEIMLAPGQSFGADSGAYNIVIIPEEG